MGSGIAQTAAMAGYDVVLHDIGTAEIERGLGAIRSSLERFVRSDRLDGEAAERVLERIRCTTDRADGFDGADVVVEAVPEMLALKQEVLQAAARWTPPHALLGTNTSQLSITKLGAALGRDAERLVGLHFFNPPVMMRLVEIVRCERTTEETLTAARQFAARLGKESVICNKDSAGFITSRAYAALRLECLRILEEGVASAEDIDRALRLGFNLPMGPLELGDFNGLDTFLHAVSALEEEHGERFRPTEGLRAMVTAGKLGRKAGEGFYRYDAQGRRLEDRSMERSRSR